MLKKIARKFVFPLALKSGVTKILNKFSNHQYMILNYHGVVEKEDPQISANHMSVKQFGDHIKYLSDNYRIVPLEKIVEEIKLGFNPPKKTIAITFDDGYENNYQFAFPILKKYNVPATIFITTCYTDTQNILWYDELDFIKNYINVAEINLNEIDLRQTLKIKTLSSISALKNLFKELIPEEKMKFLKWLKTKFEIVSDKENINPQFWKQLSSKQIIEMRDSGLIDFGSHTVNHPNLNLIPTLNIQKELVESKRKLEAITQLSITSIAYPDGAYDDEVKLLSKEAGYTALFAVDYKCLTDNVTNGIFKRFSISNTTTFESVMLQISLAFNKSGH
ncbi:N/A [soil metagenome]